MAEEYQRQEKNPSRFGNKNAAARETREERASPQSRRQSDFFDERNEMIPERPFDEGDLSESDSYSSRMPEQGAKIWIDAIPENKRAENEHSFAKEEKTFTQPHSKVVSSDIDTDEHLIQSEEDLRAFKFSRKYDEEDQIRSREEETHQDENYEQEQELHFERLSPEKIKRHVDLSSEQTSPDYEDDEPQIQSVEDLRAYMLSKKQDEEEEQERSKPRQARETEHVARGSADFERGDEYSTPKENRRHVDLGLEQQQPDFEDDEPVIQSTADLRAYMLSKKQDEEEEQERSKWRQTQENERPRHGSIGSEPDQERLRPKEDKRHSDFRSEQTLPDFEDDEPVIQSTVDLRASMLAKMRGEKDPIRSEPDRERSSSREDRGHSELKSERARTDFKDNEPKIQSNMDLRATMLAKMRGAKEQISSKDTLKNKFMGAFQAKKPLDESRYDEEEEITSKNPRTFFKNERNYEDHADYEDEREQSDFEDDASLIRSGEGLRASMLSKMRGGKNQTSAKVQHAPAIVQSKATQNTQASSGYSLSSHAPTSFTVTGVVSQSFTILLEKPLIFLLLAAAPTVVVFVVMLLFFASAIFLPNAFLLANLIDFLLNPSFSLRMIAVPFISWLIFTFGQAVTSHVSLVLLQRKQMNLVDSLFHCLSHLISIIGVNILPILIFALLSFVIALVKAGTLVTIAMIMILLPLVSYVVCMCYVAVPIVLAEEQGIVTGLKRSFDLTSGYRGKIFWLLTFAGIVTWLLGIIMNKILSFSGQTGLVSLVLFCMTCAWNTILVSVIPAVTYNTLASVKEKRAKGRRSRNFDDFDEDY